MNDFWRSRGNYGSPTGENMGNRLAAMTGQRPNTPQFPPLTGRIIPSTGDITPDEIPMDGRLAVFPMHDLSRVCLKAWTENGVATVWYIPEQQAKLALPPQQTSVSQQPSTVVIPDDFKNDILARLDAIEKTLAGQVQSKKVNTKKEEPANG